MAANLFKLKMRKNPNMAPTVDTSPVTLSEITPEAQSSLTPAVSIPPRMEAAGKPAVFDASRVPFAQLNAAPPEKPTPALIEERANKEPVRLILDANVPPGCHPVVLILDGPNQPTIYHFPTRNDYGTKTTQEGEKPVVARLNHAPSWPEGR